MTALRLAVQEQTTPSDPSPAATRPRPSAPRPRAGRPGLVATIRALRTNPITAFPEEAYQAPILEIGRLRKLMLVNDPDEIEHVLVGNAANYRKSLQQQRRLRPALGDGLLTAEGAEWHGARRIAAPLFNPGAVALLAEDMLEAAAVMRDRWLDRFQPERPIDLAAEFQRLTYEIVSRTVFSGALDQDRARLGFVARFEPDLAHQARDFGGYVDTSHGAQAAHRVQLRLPLLRGGLHGRHHHRRLGSRSLGNLLHDVPENHEADRGNQEDYPQNHNDHAFLHGASLGFLKYSS